MVYKELACDILATKFKVKWAKPELIFGPGKDVIFSNILRLD
jgi:hypothetical protein